MRQHICGMRTAYNWDGLVSLNVGRLIYSALLISVLLQQCPATEPAAPGFFWLVVITMLISEEAWVSFGHTTQNGFRAFLVVQALGVVAQAAVMWFLWDHLVAIDSVARGVRAALGGGDPLLPMRIVLGVATIPFVIAVAKCGLIRWPNVWVRRGI